ncbi:MAG: SH3 domain-containing protein [Cyanobacteria bacterium P01_A01_bin.70]
MRSRFVLGGLLAVVCLVGLGTCRQWRSRSQLPPTTADAGTGGTPTVQPTPDTWPGLTDTVSTANATNESAAQPQPAQTAGQIATLIAENPGAEVNVRSQPSATSAPIGYGQVGDTVVLGRAEPAEDGHTWHYVTFQNASTVGWVRSDLLDIPTAPSASTDESAAATLSPQSDVLKEALDEHCGNIRAIEAYFVTQSHTIYVCKIRHQHLYLSQEQGTEQVVTAQDVEALGGGYIIGNDNFEYRLDSSSLVIVRFDDAGQQEEVLREAVVYTERFD